MKTAYLLLPLVLAACSTTPVPPVESDPWERDGATARDRQMDIGQCKAQSVSVPDVMRWEIVYRACMRGKGWTMAR
jgi:hypothetical protein